MRKLNVRTLLRVVLALICLLIALIAHLSATDSGYVVLTCALLGAMFLGHGKWRTIFSAFWILLSALGKGLNARATKVQLETLCRVDLGDRRCLCPADYVLTTAILDPELPRRGKETDHPICSNHHPFPDKDGSATSKAHETLDWLKKNNERIKYIGAITRYRIK